jgi:hypothetical protein
VTAGARIEDYAMIGDMRTAALVGTDENGHWKIAPRAAAKVRRHYQHGGLILETRFTNEGGSVCIVNFMPVDEADTSIVRLVIGRNDVGLLSEKYEPRTKRMLGNFPQAFSHVALINSALCLSHAIDASKQPRPQMRHQKTAA